MIWIFTTRIPMLFQLCYSWNMIICGIWESAGLEWSYEFEGERKESFDIGDEYVDESWSERMLVEEKGYRWWGKSVILFNSAQFIGNMITKVWKMIPPPDAGGFIFLLQTCFFFWVVDFSDCKNSALEFVIVLCYVVRNTHFCVIFLQ